MARKSSFRMSIWLWTWASLRKPEPLVFSMTWTTTGMQYRVTEGSYSAFGLVEVLVQSAVDPAGTCSDTSGSWG